MTTTTSLQPQLLKKPLLKRKATERTGDDVSAVGRSFYGVHNFPDGMKNRIGAIAKFNNMSIGVWLEEVLSPILDKEEKKIGTKS